MRMSVIAAHVCNASENMGVDVPYVACRSEKGMATNSTI